ncbi:putative LRR receptor-like serine/threonine-protein kinase [Acorus gramineus]|uniref:non-specific serine/threonine protein kinase n=1 Tax=Acorus gramineus TaxID=55184 RepID=A0AAV9BGM3_ACOGR|nr:putative LRR receptor-like serine/threonine-protein kinase [Acorus gramineus]
MLANLKNLVDFRISQTNLSGKIPDFIGNWTNLQKLHIQGTNMVGPIPSTISRLTNLIDLRISDMNGSTNAVPDLSTMVNMSFLILRNCNISGKLPDNLGRMLNLTVLDLSFNKFTGEIPQSFQRLNNINYMYLTRNFLTGTVPGWMLSRRKDIDLSYNNLTWVDTLSSSSCQQETVNLLGSSYTESDLGKATPCFTNSACPHHKNYYLHINCGGDKVSVGDNTYLDDRDLGSSSRYYVSSENNWAFSSTGNFLDNEMVPDSYIESNTSILSMPDAKLYMQARISPISLTYYGLCLGNGNYTVRLHFAEIRITDGESFTSLGRRIFDVYIQGKLVMKDFNIKDKAQGSNKAIVQNYSSVPVENNTLEIRLYWAGKGTTSLPHKVFYGPLISAISVEPEFKPPGGEKAVKIVVGILSSMLFLIIMILGILWWKGFLGRKYQDLRDLDLLTASFTLRQMKAATKNFNAANKICEGGFGPVYKGLLPDGTVIAVKMLSSKSRQGNREFFNEIGMISAMQHPNLVKLLGCCVEGIQLLLVYEFMENNSLARALFGPTEYQLNLDWPTRKKICLGIARGLAYLHGESRLKIVHRDIKPTNVLLDKDLNPKISDFGLARLNDDENTHISTRIAGTVGYMAPEYATRGYLTDKADVYSFGVVILEVVSGKSNSNWRPTEDCFFLLDWAHVLLKRGQLKELIDPRLGMEFNEKEAIRMIKIVFLCTSASPVDRPSMSVVLSMLEGKTQVPDTTNLNLSTHYSNYSSSNLSEKSFSHSAKSLPVDFPHTYPTVTDSDVSLQSNVSMS